MTELSEYAKMCVILKGYRIYNGQIELDKSDFYYRFIRSACKSAQSLINGELEGYSLIKKKV